MGGSSWVEVQVKMGSGYNRSFQFGSERVLVKTGFKKLNTGRNGLCLENALNYIYGQFNS
ncbi:hypothetical protein HanRHA438_Chr16g0778591 [Helianthus annuus]|nr:hypothetical protein HanRHA438_Chr16g0778591 [Helianthus annuus]